MTRSNMQEVADGVCGVHGHNITRLEAYEIPMCTKCGMTLTEIRGDKKEEAHAARS